MNRPETGVGSGQAGTQARDRAATGGGSTATTRPATADRSTYDQLNRDARARTEGTQRTSAYGASQRSGGASTRPTTSYRPSGGGMSEAAAGGGDRGGPRVAAALSICPQGGRAKVTRGQMETSRTGPADRRR